MWNAIGWVSSSFTLVAFIVAVAAWVYRQKILQKEKLIRSASESERGELVASALEFFNVDAANLTKQQQFTLAIEQIRGRAERFRWTCVVVALVAIGGLAVAVVALTSKSQGASDTGARQEQQRVAVALIQKLGGQAQGVENRITDVTLGAGTTDGDLSRVREHLERLRDLEVLSLRHANITDTGLEHLYGLGQLKRLLLDETNVSHTGVAELRNRLPGCEVEWDADFNTARFVLKRGGTVWTKKDGRYKLDVATVADLPAMPFAVTRVSFRSNRAVTDNDLKRLSALTDLKGLILDETYITDHSLAYVAELTTLTTLSLQDVKITSDGLVHFQGLVNLSMLILSGTDVGDDGLLHVKVLPNLKTLWLMRTQVSDKGLVHLGQIRSLEELSLSGPGISDDGLKHLAALPNLKSLEVRGTRITPAAAQEIEMQIPGLDVIGVLGEDGHPPPGT